jgi:uncharacterized membrane-anchored protein
MHVRELLEEAARAGLVRDALLDPTTADGRAAREVVLRHSPAALRLVAQGSTVSVWIGACLLAAFLAAIDVTETPLGAVLGLAGLAVAAALVRAPLSLLSVQLAWVGALGGQLLILMTAAEIDDAEATISGLALALQVVTLLAVPNLALGCAAVAAGVVALLVLLTELGLEHAYGLVTLSLGAATAALWIHEAPLAGGPLRRVWQPLAYTLPLALIGALGFMRVAPAGPTWAWTAGFAALAAWAVVRAAVEAPALRGAPTLCACAGLALAAAAGHAAPGLAAGLMLLALAHLRRSALLQATALAGIGVFLFFWYYDLGVDLLTKSAAALGNGAVLLVAAALLRRWTGRAREAEAHAPRRRLGDLRWLSAALLLALALPAWQIAAKERVLATGAPVLLRLRPVDPRSLMQGDYMVLRYAIADEATRDPALPRDGALVVRLDEHRVAALVRVDDGRPLAPGELRLQFRVRDRDLRLGAESFFFPEGHADRYAPAAYGELVVAPGGESVLVGLRDERYAPLGARLH